MRLPDEDDKAGPKECHDLDGLLVDGINAHSQNEVPTSELHLLSAYT